jgi:dTDP-4-dehydrorhamnose 3,5-epimerase
MHLEIMKLKIPDVFVVKHDTFRDKRGVFAEVYKATECDIGPIVQINTSTSKHGVIRGLHYQLNPCAHGKLIIVTHGSIFDVAVDLRAASSTFGQWAGQFLCGDEGAYAAYLSDTIYIPKGFAHGFCVLSGEGAKIIYGLTCNGYVQEYERGISWDDHDLNIQWPVFSPSLSDKDLNHPQFRNAEMNF